MGLGAEQSVTGDADPCNKRHDSLGNFTDKVEVFSGGLKGNVVPGRDGLAAVLEEDAVLGSAGCSRRARRDRRTQRPDPGKRLVHG